MVDLFLFFEGNFLKNVIFFWIIGNSYDIL